MCCDFKVYMCFGGKPGVHAMVCANSQTSRWREVEKMQKSIVAIAVSVSMFQAAFGSVFEKTPSAHTGKAIQEAIDALTFIGRKIREAIKDARYPGDKYSRNNPTIRVDTYKLFNYAQRLKAVNSRVKKLDERLNGMYLKAGLDDLLKLLKTNVLLDCNKKLSRCSEYLSDTADDFNKAESDIVNKLQSSNI